ncbi:MAG: ABC transporter permease [Longimicrobiales bacterium]
MNARRWYRRALRVYAPRFRRLYGDELEAMFADAWSDARRRGAGAVVGLLARTARDLIRNGLATRLEGTMTRGGGSHDVRHALRALARRPGFTAVAVATLALGLGGNTAMFGIVHAAWLGPLPYPADDELVVPYNQPRPSQGGGFAAFSAPFYAAIRDEGVFTAVTDIVPTGATLGGDDRPERVSAARVDASFFRVAGVEPALGRVFAEDEAGPGGPAVVVVSHGVWNRRLGGDPRAVGSTLVVDGRPATVVGVMPPGFGLIFEGVEVWLPTRTDEAAFTPTTALNNNRVLVARLAGAPDDPGVRAGLAVAVDRLRERYPDAVGDEHAVGLVPLRTHLHGDSKGTLGLLLGAVGLVLLIACANLANLLLVRGEARRAELAVRTALGAARSRLVRVLMAEHLILAGLGALGGLAVSAGLLAAVRPLAPSGLPLSQGLLPGPGVLAFTAALALVTSLVFGLAPAWHLGRTDLRGALGGSGRGGGTGTASRLRGGLVVGEVALTVVLLVGSGLVLHSLARLRAVDPGFAVADRTVVPLEVSAASAPDAAAVVRFHRRVLDDLIGRPAVTAAGLGMFVPLSGSANWGYEAEGAEDDGGGVRFADYNLVTPGYFDAVGQEVVRGRGLRWSDVDPAAPPVMLVSATMARNLWPDGSALGRRINIDTDGRVWREVVGVVSDVRNRSLAREADAVMYFPPVDLPMASPRSLQLVVHHADGPAPMETVRAVVHGLDPTVPLTGARTYSSIERSSERPRLFAMVLLGLFAGVAFALAAVGLYGVVSYTVSLRAREIGLRMAVGADRSSVMAWVLRTGGRLVVLGLVLGLVASVALAGLVEHLLHGVAPADPLTYVAVVTFVGLMAVVATAIPALRAASLRPAEVLLR